VTVNVEVVLGLAQEMYPAAITQKDKQLVRSALPLFPVSWLPSLVSDLTYNIWIIVHIGF
jgi:hypothetical protein